MKHIALLILTLFTFPTLASNTVIKVMVVDTGIYPHRLLKPFLAPGYTLLAVDYPLQPTHVHGTHVAGIIAYGDLRKPDPVCKEVQIISCKGLDPSPSFDALRKSTECFQKAIKKKVDFVNYSGGGETHDTNEFTAIKNLNAANIITVVATGNDKKNLGAADYYPASYALKNDLKNIIPVMNLEYDGTMHELNNYSGGLVVDYGTKILSTFPNDTLDYMTGTSQAAAMYTHRLLQKACRKLHENDKNDLPKVSDDVIKILGGFHEQPNRSPKPY